jgi:hypothetical protein
VRLVLLVTPAIVPALDLALDVGLNERKAAISNAHGQAMDLARMAAQANDHLIAETRDLMAGLVHVPVLREAPDPGLR